MVSMTSMHFFRWTEQLRDAGHEIYWFDVMDTKKETERLNWVNQIIKWRIKYNYPYRYFVKKKLPKLYRFIQKFNDNDIATVFEQKLNEIKPDLVHSFAMQLSCIPILDIMLKQPQIKWVYSSWGSDVYFSHGLNMNEDKIRACFNRIDYLITDCERDYKIATEKGFTNMFLGVFPGNGGVDFAKLPETNLSKRKIILVKGYNFGVGRGLNIVKALSKLQPEQLKEFKIIVYGADQLITEYVSKNENLSQVDIEIHSMKKTIPNAELIAIMGKSYLHIGNGISDGIPNSMIEAMGMGAFPIQSNPGNATAELIHDEKNGLLINNADDIDEIQNRIQFALLNPEIVKSAFEYNSLFIRQNYNRDFIKPKITALYESIH